MPSRIDLNSDVGEGFGPYTLGSDVALLPYVTSVSVACGFHAGDPRTIDRTVELALKAGAAVGAHPGYWDLRGFGRRPIPAEPDEITTDVLYQVGALAAFARVHGTALRHVKPHGALYNQAAQDEALARAIARAIARFDRRLTVVGLASSALMREACEEEGLRFAAEAFADRAYNRDGTLLSRKRPDAMVTEPEAAAAQALRIAREGWVRAVDGSDVPIRADTLCLHSDTPRAAEIARAVRSALEGAGIKVMALPR